MAYSAASAVPSGLAEEVAAIAHRMGSKYNCSFSIAVRASDWQVSAAAGTIDFSSGRQVQPSDTYAWGSVTKMFTAASVMKLVSQGAFGLDDRVAPLIDPILAKMAKADPTLNFSSAEDLWGKRFDTTTVRRLLSMKSGVPDFDTAQPSPKGYVDPLRVDLYSRPQHDFTPPELMSVPWVAHKWNLKCALGIVPICYSSTNFMLLGLILAAHAGLESWEAFDPSTFLPPSLSGGQVLFARGGSPSRYSPVHGYDRTTYNMPEGVVNNVDIWEVDGVFAGWTASSILMNASSAADLAWEIYGPPCSVAPCVYAAQMVPTQSYYGLGTFNLYGLGGQKGLYGVAYGHLGATYGYQSVVAYFPEAQLTIAIATNIETDIQAHPSHGLCLTYNAALGAMLNRTIACDYVQESYYGGFCNCTGGPGNPVVELPKATAKHPHVIVV